MKRKRNPPQMTPMDTDREKSRGINRRDRREKLEETKYQFFSAALCG
jgi:hypothetical protein